MTTTQRIWGPDAPVGPLERALDLAPTGLVVIDPAGRIRWANQRMGEMLQTPHAELPGRDLADFVHETEGPIVPLDAVLPGRTIDRSRRRLRRAGGSIAWVRMIFTRLGGNDGWVVHVADISEIVRAEERLGLLVEGLDDGVVVVDPDHRIASVNPAAARMLGVGQEGMVGRPLAEWIVVDEGGTVVSPAERPEAIAMHTGTATHAVLGVMRNDRLRWVRVSAQPLQRTASERWVVASYKDVTDRRRALEAIEADRAKSEFLSHMSHELRTPLNSVLGFAQLLRGDALPERQREAVDQILRAGQHLLGLVDEVLDLARIESDRLDIVLESVSLEGALREAFDLVQPLASTSNVAVELAVADTESLHVRADRQRLRQVLLNLLTNAIKYNHRDGSVSLSAQESDGVVTIRVSDSGRGIAADKLDRLFTPFERLGAEHLGVEGVGVGLALSKRLVEAMNGAITVESEIDRGSVFSVTLSATTPSLATAAGDEQLAVRSLRSDGTRRRVLYIEDNDANRRLMERVAARDERIELITARRAADGLALARSSLPDVILLDLHLPDRPGEDVLREILGAADTARIPVVVVSADATPSRIEHLLGAGAVAYLTKPIDIAELLEILDAALNRST